MLIPPPPIRVLMATKPVDIRKGMDGLAALVKEHLNADPFSGVIFCFRAKRADRVKLIFWDGTGLCLFAKRLEGGKFHWPRIEDGAALSNWRSMRRRCRCSILGAVRPRPATSGQSHAMTGPGAEQARRPRSMATRRAEAARILRSCQQIIAASCSATAMRRTRSCRRTDHCRLVLE